MLWRITAFDRDGREIARIEASGGEVTIGRDTDRRLVLPSASVSRRHAKLVLDGPQPYILDEGSANGVIVNGVRIAGPTAIVPGVRVDVADFHLEFEVPPATEAVSPISERRPQVAAADPGDSVRLVAEGGAFDGRVYDIPVGEIAVGRAIDNDVVLDDPSLSRKHAKVYRGAGSRLEVEDLGSSNGTFVNGRKIGRAAAGPGDTVRFGELSFRVEGSGAESTSYGGPQERASRGWIVWAAVGAGVLIIGGGVTALLLKGKGGGKDVMAQMAEQAESHLKAGKDKLQDRKFEAAAMEFAEVLRIDPANVEARRLKSLAEDEPEHDKTSKKVGAKVELGDRPSFESAIRLYGAIPAESVFRTPTGQKLVRKLVAFGEGQCKARKYADCAWAICKAYDVAPEGSRPGADASGLLKDAEKKLVKDKSYMPCKKH